MRRFGVKRLCLYLYSFTPPYVFVICVATGSKPMQDNWCGEEMPMQNSCHSNWEEEEEMEISMWNNNTYMKKPPKVRIRCTQSFCFHQIDVLYSIYTNAHMSSSSGCVPDLIK